MLKMPSSRLSVYADLVKLCSGDQKKAGFIYDQLVRRYYTTTSIFDGNYSDLSPVRETARLEFAPTQDDGAGPHAHSTMEHLAEEAASYLQLVNDVGYTGGILTMSDGSMRQLDELRDAYLEFHRRDTMSYTRNAPETEGFRIKCLRMLGCELDDFGEEANATIMDIVIPSDIINALALEVKQLSQVNRQLRALEVYRRENYRRPGTVVPLESDLTFLDAFEAEIETVTLCMHPVFGLQAIAAYISGKYATCRTKQYEPLQQSFAKNAHPIHEIKISNRVNMYASNAPAEQSLLDSITELHKDLADRLRGNSSIPEHMEVFNRLKEWIQLQNTQNKSERVDWRLKALETTERLQKYILNMWRRQTIGIVFAHGFSFIDSAIEHTENSVKSTGFPDTNMNGVFMNHVMNYFYKECLLKKFNRKMASGPVIEFKKDPAFLQLYRQHIEAYKDRDDDSVITTSTIIGDYREFTTGSTKRKRTRAYEGLKFEVNEAYKKTNKPCTVPEFHITSDMNFKSPPMDIGVFEHLFPPARWRDHRDQCVLSVVSLYLKSLSTNYLVLDKWLAGTALQGYSPPYSSAADLFDSGTTFFRKNIALLDSLLSKMANAMGGTATLRKGRSLQWVIDRELDLNLGSAPRFPATVGEMFACYDLEYYLIHKGVPCANYDSRLAAILPHVAKTDVMFIQGGPTSYQGVAALDLWRWFPWYSLFKKYDLSSAVFGNFLGKIVDVKSEQWGEQLTFNQQQHFMAMQSESGAREWFTYKGTLLFAMLGACVLANLSEQVDSFEALVGDIRKWAFLYIAYIMPDITPDLHVNVTIANNAGLPKDKVIHLEQLNEELQNILDAELPGIVVGEMPGQMQMSIERAVDIINELDASGGAVQMERDVSYAALAAFQGKIVASDNSEMFELNDFIVLCASRPDIAHQWRQFLCKEMTLFDFLVPKMWISTNQYRIKLQWALQEARKYWHDVANAHKLPKEETTFNESSHYATDSEEDDDDDDDGYDGYGYAGNKGYW